MTIQTQNEGNILTMFLEGRLDSSTAEELETAINGVLSADTEKLIINLHEVDYVSSAGLRVMVKAYKALSGKPLVIQQPNDAVREVLNMSGLLKFFAIE